MNKAEFDHVLRVAADLIGETDFVVVGSQSIIGYLKHVPPGLARSKELDIYPLNAVQQADLIEVIGIDSPFHQRHGYYADVVDETTAHLPAGWRDRAEKIVVRKEPPVRAICPEANDLVAAKLVAGREKDRDYAREAFKAGVASTTKVGRRLRFARADLRAIDRARSWIDGFKRIRNSIEGINVAAGAVLAGGDPEPLRRRLDAAFARYALTASLLHGDFRAALSDAERRRIIKAAAKGKIALPDLSAPS